ncbi:hypothetical protein QOZ80_2AG0121970 [Eleusine coracana subsp. coracana]|nr:hypothetical protein QOZ80_2AG0121970 [Eleusine coracana subsp. coracana]
MTSMGFAYAQVSVQQERYKLALQEKKKKTTEGGGGEDSTNKRSVVDNRRDGGGTWVTGRVHPSAETVAASPPNGAQ